MNYYIIKSYVFQAFLNKSSLNFPTPHMYAIYKENPPSEVFEWWIVVVIMRFAP